MMFTGTDCIKQGRSILHGCFSVFECAELKFLCCFLWGMYTTRDAKVLRVLLFQTVCATKNMWKRVPSGCRNACVRLVHSCLYRLETDALSSELCRQDGSAIRTVNTVYCPQYTGYLRVLGYPLM